MIFMREKRGKHMLKNIKWQALMIAVIYIATGIFLVMFPEQVQTFICNIVGIAAIVIGVIKAFTYIAIDAKEAVYRNDFVEGTVFVLCGILVIYQKAIIQTLIPFIISIVILVDGFSKLQDGIDAKRLGYPNSKLYIILSAISIVLGLVIMFNLIESSKAIFMILGIGMIYCGITELVSVFFLANKLKKFIENSEQALAQAAQQKVNEEKAEKAVDAEIVSDNTTTNE